MTLRPAFYVKKNTPPALFSAAFMALSAICRTFYLTQIWPSAPAFFILQGLLPIAANIIFIVLILRFSESHLHLTLIPVLMGCAFFIIKAFSFTPLHQILCTILYTGAGTIYTLTVFGKILTSRLLIPLFGLPFIYHIFVEDLPVFLRKELTFVGWLPEISVLLIMLALFSAALGFKKFENTDVQKGLIS